MHYLKMFFDALILAAFALVGAAASAVVTSADYKLGPVSIKQTLGATVAVLAGLWLLTRFLGGAPAA